MKKYILLILLLLSTLVAPRVANAVKIKANGKKIIPARTFVFDSIPLNLAEITSSAGVIFSGKCTGVRNIEKDEKSRLPVIEYVFEVEESIKGLGEVKEYKFREWNLVAKRNHLVIGEEYVLFLYGTSSLGLTSIVGVFQGKFLVSKSGDTKIIKNKISNKGLFKNIRTGKEVHLKNKLLEKKLRSIDGSASEDLNYEDFIEIVKELNNDN